MYTQETLLEGTCVGLGNKALVIQGPSGCGKSDLALRFIYSTSYAPFKITDKPFFIADDQVKVTTNDHHTLFVSPPSTISGLLEVRGIGIIHVPFQTAIPLYAIVQCCPHNEIERLPSSQTTKIHDIDYPVFYLDPFAASAVTKLWLILTKI